METAADVPKRFSSLIVELPVQQSGSGDPSPENIRPISQWTDVALYVADTDTATEPTVTTILPTPIFGGMVDVARGEVASMYNEKKSSSGWEMVEEGHFRCQVSAFNNGDETSTNVADLYSSHYKTVSNKDAYDATYDFTCGTPTIEGVTYLYVNDLNYTTLEDFTAYIGDVQFVYKSHIPMSDVIEPTIVYLPEGTSYVWADAGFVEVTVTGTPPLSLPNSLGKPLKAWEVNVSPYQDLHGYANPWPAGGGVNKFDLSDCTVRGGTYGLTITPNVQDETIRVHGTPTWPDGDTILSFAIFDVTKDYSGLTSNVFIINKTDNISAITTAYTSSNQRIVLGVTKTGVSDVDFTIQLSFASTSQSAYSPYSNLCPIHGTDKLTITTAGKNLFDEDLLSGGSANGVTFVKNPDGSITLNGTATGNVTIQVMSKRDMPSARYVISGVPANSSGTGLRLWARDDNRYFSAYNGITDNGILSSQVYSYITVANGTTVDNVTIYPQLEIGTIASDYTPHVAPSTTVLTLPQTVYTGTIGSEGGESRDVSVVYNGINMQWTTGFGGFMTAQSLVTGYDNPDAMPELLCDIYPVMPYNQATQAPPAMSVIYGGEGYIYNGRIVVRDNTVSTLSEFITQLNGHQIVYRSTPAQFAITASPIPTPTGTATTWATAEDGIVDEMEATYIAKQT